MTTKIIFDNRLGDTCEAFIHEEHECDMINLLFNHKNRKEVCTNTKKYDGVEWFYLKLTEKDVKEIKKTSWYFNNQPTSYLIDTDIIIEVFSVQ